MKILHVIHRYPPAVGGSEVWCRELGQRLAAAGDEVKVVTLDVIEEDEYWRDPSVERCIVRLGRLAWDRQVLVRRYRRSLPVHSLYHSLLKVVLDRWLRIYFYGPHSLEMYGHLMSEARDADVVHLHTLPHPHNFVGYLAARLRGKRVVITPHFHPGHPNYERRSNYWLLKRCDAVIAVSEYERDYLSRMGVDAAKIVTTGNGVDVEDYAPSDVAAFKAALLETHGLAPDVSAIVFVGRKLEFKGIATLVDAVRGLSGRRDVALFLVGPSSPWFEAFYGSLPAEDRRRIIDLGVLSHADKVDLLHLADVLVLPSRHEAFGIVLLEAWACGTPVIAAAAGALPSIVGDGGFVFEPGDDADLAAKIERMLDDAELAREMARRGREQLLSRYTWEKIATTVRKAYLPAPETTGRRRVLICSNMFPPYTGGGAEIVAYKEAVILGELGMDVHVFCGRVESNARPSYEPTVENGELRKTRLSLLPADISGESWNFRNDTIRRRFAQVLDHFAPDVVHFHNLVGLSVTMIDECHRRAIPTVLTLHDYWGVCFKNTMLKNDGSLCVRGGFDCLDCKATLRSESSVPSPVRNAHILLSLRKVDRFVAPSQYLADRYVANGIPSDRVSVIKYGIELERFQDVRREHPLFTLGFIGYLGKHKGLDVILRAIGLLPDSGQVRLLVAGDGEEKANLEALCQQLRLDRVVTFSGWVDNRNIRAIYEQIDVLVVPSVWPENSPVIISEAMASGIPVIASDIGGIPELVRDEITGLLAPPRDARAFADAIERLRKDPDLRARMGQTALETIRQEGLRGQVMQVAQLFAELSASPRARGDAEVPVVLYSSDLYWHRSLHELLRQLAQVEERLRKRVLVCRLDLCDEDTLRSAKLLVLPTSGRGSFLEALKALQMQIPLLVNDNACELKELCRQSNAGLAYSGAAELRECLELLLTNEPLRKAMGANGHKFIGAQAAELRADG